MEENNQRPTIYQQVTSTIISDLKQGSRPWIKPWKCSGMEGLVHRPLRTNDAPYNGINILILWQSAIENGYFSPYWMTYRQAQSLGGQVQKGEKSTRIVYMGQHSKDRVDSDDDPEARQTITFYKAYSVYNARQIKGLPEKFNNQITPEHSEDRNQNAEAFLSNTGAVIRVGGDKASYNPPRDFIQMPDISLFNNSADYYSTSAHELVHWTGHPKRLERFPSNSHDTTVAYAKEELVAEIGSAFLAADLGLTLRPRKDHAAYIQSWMRILGSDPKAIFHAASQAQKAANYLHGLQPKPTHTPKHELTTPNIMAPSLG